MRSRFTDFSLEALTKRLGSYGQPAYRARQLFRWVYQRLAASFEEMSDLPAGLRETLAKSMTLQSLRPAGEVASHDGSTVKVLFELDDGKAIESVLMLAEAGGEGRGRNTLCVSSQVGCLIRCPFCATGQQGFERNLSAGEIIEQVLHFQRRLVNHHYNEAIGELAPRRITNVVFMGMGEPLANYEAVRQSIETLISREGPGLSARRITVSTCGLMPEIRRLAREEFHVELAVSLHAASNTLRNRLVPVNRKYPLEVLIPAAVEYFEKTGRRPTFEYILFRGLNDSAAQARELAGLLHGLNCHVNLIAASPTPGQEFAAPSARQVRIFQEELTRQGISNTLRVSRGLDIKAACGQLRARRMAAR